MPNEAQKHTKKSIVRERSGKHSQEYNSMNEDIHKNTDEKLRERPDSGFEQAEKQGAQNSNENTGKKEETNDKDWKIDDVKSGK